MLFSRLGTNRGPADFLGKEPIMSEIQTTNWNEVAANNTATAPNGIPTGGPNYDLYDWGREIMAAVKRDWDRAHTTLSSTGSSDAYVLTYTVAPPAYADGLRFSFKANFANTGSATCNVNGLGAKTIKKNGSSGPATLSAGDIQTNNHVELEYDLAADALILLNPLGADAPTAGTGIDVTGTAVSLDFLDLTSETSVAGSDEIAIYDASASAHRKMTRANFVAGLGPTAGTGIGVSGTAVSLDIPALTAETTVAADDTVAIYDASASAHRKMTRANFVAGLATPMASFSAHKNGTDQTGIVTNTTTKVTFPTESFDTDGYYDAANSKFLPTNGATGRWKIGTSLTWKNGGSAPHYAIVKIYKNGISVAHKNETFNSSTNTYWQTTSFETLVTLNGSSDYVEIYAHHDGTSDESLYGDSLYTFFFAYRVG
jgi:hypothetical protein